MKRSEHGILADRKINTVALLGGTHGNELTGVTVVRRRQAAKEQRFSPQAREMRGSQKTQPHISGPFDPGELPAASDPATFTLQTLIANPEAVRQNRRYITYDLNRSFRSALLDAPHTTGYEAQRAQVLNTMLGPKGSKSPAVDFSIDLHTTTARLGPTVIIREDDLFARWLAAYVIHELPDVRVMSYLAEEGATVVATGAAGGAPGAADAPGDYPYVTEITPAGMEIEVGPVPQGVVRAETLIWTERIVNSCIAGIDAWNNDQTVDIADTLTVYRYREAIDYPRDEHGELAAFVHPLRQDRDFTPLQTGDPLFLKYDGSTVAYDGVPGRVPVFINEAAYYEKNAAMTLCEKREVDVSRI